MYIITIAGTNIDCKRSGCALFCCKEGGKRLEQSIRREKHFFRALAAFYLPYNRTDHSQGFFIC